MPNTRNARKDDFQTPAALFAASWHGNCAPLAQALCQGLANLERTSKTICNSLDSDRQALGESLPDDVLVAPTQISDDGYAFYGTTTLHRISVAALGRPMDAHDETAAVQMFFVTGAKEPAHWAARVGDFQFAEREAGAWSPKTNRVEGAGAPWLLSERFFTAPGFDPDLVPMALMALLSSLTALVDTSVSRQRKVLQKLGERIHAKQLLSGQALPGAGAAQESFPQAAALLRRFRLGQAARDAASGEGPASGPRP